MSSKRQDIKEDQDLVTEKNDSPQESPVAVPSLIYCGPNLPKGILNQFTVYRGGLPKHLEKHFEPKACPEIKFLFVPVENFTQTLQAANTRGTAESVWFTQIQKYCQGGVK